MRKSEAGLEIIIHRLPMDAPIGTLEDRLRAVLELFPAPDLQVDAAGPGKLLLDRLRPLGARPLPKGPLAQLLGKERPTYAEAFVQRYAETLARRVHVERSEAGDAVIRFAGRTETVPMGTQIVAEEAFRALALAVERLFNVNEED